MLLYVNLAATLAVTAYALYLFFQVVYSRYLFVKLGKKSTDAPNLSERINSLLVNGFGQKKLFKDKKSGVMHFILFYTFFILQWVF